MTKIEENAENKLVAKVFKDLLEAGKTLHLMFDGKEIERTEEDVDKVNRITAALFYRLLITNAGDDADGGNIEREEYLERLTETRHCMAKVMTIVDKLCKTVVSNDIEKLEKETWKKIIE